MASLFESAKDFYFTHMSYAYEDTIYHTNRTLCHILPWSAVTLYLIALWGLPKILPKKGFNLKYLFFAWNMFLSLFSVCMFFGISIPYAKYFIFELKGDLVGVACDRRLSQGADPSKFWAYMFAWSKYLELFDTILVILKHPQRPVMFLHWYHHVTVLLFTWYASMYQVLAGYLFACVNACVHMFMYYFYAMATIGKPPKWSMYLTLGQTTQMIIGTIFNAVWAYQQLYGDGSCYCYWKTGCRIMLVACAVMYISYFMLFAKLFVEKYITKTKGKPRDASKAKKAE